MVARRNDVRTQVEQLLRDRWRNSKAARRVFPIDDQQIDRVGLHHVRQMFADDAPSRRPKYVSHKKNIHLRRL